MLLMIDNYDSFTYNLVQYFGELKAEVKVVRNDELSVEQIEALAPERIVLSPGPCTPNEAGVSLAVIERFAGKLPLLGVCLGHQSIGQAFGGEVVRARQVMHGKTSPIHHKDLGVFAGLANPLTVTRYHSLVVKREPAGVPGDHRLDPTCRRIARRDHGRTPQDPECRGRAVPSRVHPHRAGPRVAGQLPPPAGRRAWGGQLRWISREPSIASSTSST